MRMVVAQVDMLQHLATLAKGPVQKIEVLVRVVSSLFDINPSMSTHMAVPLWKRCVATLLEVILPFPPSVRLLPRSHATCNPVVSVLKVHLAHPYESSRFCVQPQSLELFQTS